MPDFDTLRQAQEWFVQVVPRGDGRGTPIDFSRVQHGAGPIVFERDPADGDAPTAARVQEEIRRQLGR